jgi:hypothetical protein
LKALANRNISTVPDDVLKERFMQLSQAEANGFVDCSLSTLLARNNELAAIEEEARERELPFDFWCEEAEQEVEQ